MLLYCDAREDGRAYGRTGHRLGTCPRRYALFGSAIREDGIDEIELEDLYAGGQQSAGADEEVFLHASDTGAYVGAILVAGAAGVIDSSDFVLI